MCTDMTHHVVAMYYLWQGNFFIGSVLLGSV